MRTSTGLKRKSKFFVIIYIWSDRARKLKSIKEESEKDLNEFRSI